MDTIQPARGLAKDPILLRDILVCPTDKAQLQVDSLGIHDARIWKCVDCNREYLETDYVIDFVPDSPHGLETPMKLKWLLAQEAYERSLSTYTDTEAALALDRDLADQLQGSFLLSGFVLDVGGGYGPCRRYLRDATLYLVVDPCTDYVLNPQPSYRVVLPNPDEPFFFIRGIAEFLPITTGVVDTVVMRAVLDHCMDPWFAIHEAWRVLGAEGHLLVGMTFDEDGTFQLSLPERVRQFAERYGWSAIPRHLLAKLAGRSEMMTGHVAPLDLPLFHQMIRQVGFFVEDEVVSAHDPRLRFYWLRKQAK